jgi:hypothetical protein
VTAQHVQRFIRFEIQWLLDRQAKFERRLFDRRHLQLTAAAGGAIGLRIHRHDFAACGTGAQGRYGEFRRAGKDDA